MGLRSLSLSFLHPFKTGGSQSGRDPVPKGFLEESRPPAFACAPGSRASWHPAVAQAGLLLTASLLISEGTSHGAGGQRSQLPDSLSKIFRNHAKLGKIATVFCEVWVHSSSMLEGGGKEP